MSDPIEAIRTSLWEARFEDARYSILAALDAAGWKLVPKNPTKEMWDAACEAIGYSIPSDMVMDALKAALAVAPKPE
jgi:hypothetical protein